MRPNSLQSNWILAGGSLVFAALLAVLPTRAQTVIPPNTPIEIRLTERLSTQHSRQDSSVLAILSAPVLSGDAVLLPLGSKVEGKVVEVHSVRLGFAHETSSIGLQMERLVLPDGTIVPFTAKVAQIENSREVINRKGYIAGVRSTSTLSHKASGAVGTLALSNPIALIFTTASSASLLRFSDPEISLPTYTELVLLTMQPITIMNPGEVTTPAVAETAETQSALQRTIRRQPFRTTTDPRHTPSDLINLMLIGEGPSIVRALQAAGWMPVDSLDAASTYRTIRSFSEQQAYRTAPMSTLRLENEKPAYALAKTLDTFSKRHHLRIFASSNHWHDEPVWLSSSTQDIGIGFSSSQKNFIHQIDHNIDHERTKVVNDLMLTGCVKGLNLVARPWLPDSLKNGTGEEIVTDKSIAVVRIDHCDHPMNVPPIEQTATDAMQQNRLTSAVRQTTLSLRGMLLRDNLAVTAYGGIKAALALRHPKPPEQPLSVSSVIDTRKYKLGESLETYEQKPGLNRHSVEEGAAAGTVVDSNLKSPGRVSPYSVELGLHGGYAGYAGGNGAAIGYLFIPDIAGPNPAYVIILGNEFSGGYNLGGSVTLNTHEHFSHEISFDYSHTVFALRFGNLGLSGMDSGTDPVSASQFSFEPATLATSEVAYNLQYLPLRRSSRWRPYLSAGPALRLAHLADSPIKKASPWFRLGLSTVGAVTAAYQFGSTPPLDGGGIFQLGLQYGAGLKYRAGRHLLLRADYKETLTAQPDFWSKSKDEIYDEVALPDYNLTVVGPFLDGPMRQQHATLGVSFIF